MTQHCFTCVLDEPGLGPLADLIAAELRAGDTVALYGELGAGKTTLARAIIRAALGEPDAEVPSPTFSLVQHYTATRLALTHCDFYRLSGDHDVDELGLEEALTDGAVLIEWPDRAPQRLAADRLELTLAGSDAPGTRVLTAVGHGRWRHRITRLMAIKTFLHAHDWGEARCVPIAGDASSRRYFRVADRSGQVRHTALLMDAPAQPDGPVIRDGKPYSQIAHLAEHAGPFIAIARHLCALGLSAPTIYAADLPAGLVLIEDFGDCTFAQALKAGRDQKQLWRSAVSALRHLHRAPLQRQLPIGDGQHHKLPVFDLEAMRIEVELLVDWYVPVATGAPLGSAAKAEFLGLWQAQFNRLAAQPPALVLRDYHSPNLLWLPERDGAARVGIIDFQDALIGPAAYDLVSVLQDARLDVAADLERALYADYVAGAAAADPWFDAAGFAYAYAAIGAQRNTKILGIFARLAVRDQKPRYLQHVPRIWQYLARDLAHPQMASLRGWYDRHLPSAMRRRVPVI